MGKLSPVTFLCGERNGCFLLNEVGDLTIFWHNFILLLLLFVL